MIFDAKQLVSVVQQFTERCGIVFSTFVKNASCMPQFERLAFGCVLRIGFMKQKQTPVTETRQSVRNLECTDSLSNIAFNSLSKSKDIEHLPQCNNINSHFVEKIIIVYSEGTKPSKTMR